MKPPVDGDKEHKAHRMSKVGRKAGKKQKDKAAGRGGDKSKTTKGHTFHSAVKAGRSIRRAADVFEKKAHLPQVDRTPLEPPPVMVAVVGPPNVGKTTLLQSLIKFYTRQNMKTPQGPITIVSGKKRRITFMECPNDINAMIDIAKVADLVLLLIDASFGFEMEVFEFLHICQVHGMPRVMGLLTHLDIIKQPKRMKEAKKTLKHRFWTEVYQGAKLFYMSSVQNGLYLKRDVKNLSRFISVMKFKPMAWRATHPYVVVDRMEDITNPEDMRLNPKGDRNVCLYGYVRGSNMMEDNNVHIPGIGDSRIHSIHHLPDPCPLPDKARKRGLGDREKLLYAPFAGAGGIVYDKDAVYIDLKGSHSHLLKNDERLDPEDRRLADSLSTTTRTLDEQMSGQMVQVFDGMDATTEGDSGDEENEDDVDNPDDSDGTGSDYSDYEDMEPSTSGHAQQGNGKDELTFGFTKSDMYLRAAKDFQERLKTRHNWMKIVYGQEGSQCRPGSDSDDDYNEQLEGGLFRRRDESTRPGASTVTADLFADCSSRKNTTALAVECSRDWLKQGNLEQLCQLFVSKDEISENEDEDDDMADMMDADELASRDDDDDGDVYGSFEDLETGEVHAGQVKKDDENNSEEMEPDDQPQINLKARKEEELAKKRMEKKQKLKQLFNAEYDEGAKFIRGLQQEAEQQTQLNRSMFEDMEDEQRVKLEGYRPGMYVRIELEPISPEFVTHFEPVYPYLVCGLLSGEQNIACVQTRLMKHRWYPKILKTRDPLVLSVGWRRFQTMPIYSMQDHNGRHRMLKYTPEHLYCHATFWGPVTPQNTGILAVQNNRQSARTFRLAGTGVVLSQDKSIRIVKKLKLTGYPLKVQKKTAFIKDMFNSALEVAKFEGAAIKTVSGIRGQVKKAIKIPPGTFRATFEDKIMMSDIVFLRAWVNVDVPRLYCPVSSHFLPVGQKTSWTGMKTVGQLRYERGLPVPQNQDSLYRPIQREEFVSRDLVIPKKLQQSLPYAVKPKFDMPEEHDPTDPLIAKHSAVILEPHESEVNELMSMLRTIHAAQKAKERKAMEERAAKHQKEQKKWEDKRSQKHKDMKRRICRALSKQEKQRAREANRNNFKR